MQPLAATPILIDQVFERLLAAIADGTLIPGERLRQAELAARLGVSRQPVSHALQLLKRHGLVQESGRKGLAVMPIDAARIRQLYEVRSPLEGLAARLAAQRVAAGRAHPALREACQSALAQGSALVVANAANPELVRADAAFHRALYRLSGNPAIEEMVAAVWPHLMRAIAAVLEISDYGERAWSEHASILSHVFAGDPEGAERAAREHTEQAGQITASRLMARAAAA